jgi:hypothetical protein
MSAIEGFVPKEVIQTFSAYLDFYYLVRQNVLDDNNLIEIQDALNRFHAARMIFQQLGIRPNRFSLPCQHAMKHYAAHIQNFGAPNGLCSPITESAHIHFVKRPWRRSSRNEPMEEMLIINERIDKLAAARTDFSQHGMLINDRRRANDGLIIEVPDETESGPIDGPMHNGVTALAQTAGKHALPTPCFQEAESVLDKVHPSLHSLGVTLWQEDLTTLVRKYLYYYHHPSSATPPHQLSPHKCPITSNHVSRIRTYNSATSFFYAPSNQCGPGGMFCEVIWAVSHWGMGEIPGPRYDCIYVANCNTPGTGMCNLRVARVRSFFAFEYGSETHCCALVHWYKLWRNEPDPDNGMYIVQPDIIGGRRNMAVISVDPIIHASHLLPIFDDTPLDHSLNYTQSLDVFKAFYVNHLVDPHAYELIV